MTNKYVVLDRDAFANEGVARNLTASTDDRILLNLNKTSDARLIPHCAAVKVRESEYLYGAPQDNIGSDAVERFHAVLMMCRRRFFSLLRHDEPWVVVPTWPTFASRNPRKQAAAGLTTNRQSVSSSFGPAVWADKSSSPELPQCDSQAGWCADTSTVPAHTAATMFETDRAEGLLRHASAPRENRSSIR